MQEVTMLKAWFSRSKRLLAGAAVCAALAAPLVAPVPADAAWVHGWHGGWRWRGGVVVGAPAVVIGVPAYAPAYPYGVPYHWIPAHYTPWGAFVPGHWGY